MDSRAVAAELRYGLSELEECPLNVVADAVTQQGDTVFVVENTDHPSERFSVVVVTGDVTARERPAGTVLIETRDHHEQ